MVCQSPICQGKVSLTHTHTLIAVTFQIYEMLTHFSHLPNHLNHEKQQNDTNSIQKEVMIVRKTSKNKKDNNSKLTVSNERRKRKSAQTSDPNKASNESVESRDVSSCDCDDDVEGRCMHVEIS